MRSIKFALVFVLFAYSASAQTLTVPSALYQPGTYNAGPATVPMGLTYVSVSFTREAWPTGVNWTDPNNISHPNIVIVPRIEISYDGGATWPDFVSSAWSGGVRVDRFGVTALSETMQRDMPQPNNPNRRIRAVTEVLVATRTAITLTAK